MGSMAVLELSLKMMDVEIPGVDRIFRITQRSQHPRVALI